MRYDNKQEKQGRRDHDVWRLYKKGFEARHVLKNLSPVKIAVADDELEFDYAWKNGIHHCLQPVSFDLAGSDSIRESAHRWLGKISSVKDARDKFKVYILTAEPQRAELREAYEAALSILQKIPVEREVISEQEADAFTERFAATIKQHERSV